jgi:predicted nucleic acid-binding protein
MVVMAAVPDASVLITLAKIHRLHLIKKLYGRGIIGPVVQHEVVDEGKRIGAPGVQLVEQALQEGWLATARPRSQHLAKRLARTTRLHAGEIEAISIAQEHKNLLIVDDNEARHVAEAMGIRFIGTAGLLLQAFREKHLALEEFDDAIAELTKVLWLSPTVVASILKKAREES